MTDRSTDRPDAPRPVSPGEDPAVSKPAGAAPAVDPRELEKKIVEVLKTCYDPEIPVNIYEMGLIYKVEVNSAGAVRVVMTLTSPMCPVAESLPPEVESRLWNVNGVTEARVEVTWDPPWTPDMMSEAAKLQLNMM